MLGTLPWSSSILGFETHEAITHLAAYLTQECTVYRQKGTIEVEIEGPYFYTYLKSSFKAGELQYKDSASFTRARSLGEALQSGQRTSIGFISNIHNNHWIATVIDFSKQYIWYGDSLVGQPDKEFITVIQWWIQYHAGTHFATGGLAIPRQHDSFSCGILAFGALAHFYLPNEYPLIDVEWVDDERLKIFLQIGKHHLNHAAALVPSPTEHSSVPGIQAAPGIAISIPSSTLAPSSMECFSVLDSDVQMVPETATTTPMECSTPIQSSISSDDASADFPHLVGK
ncbi:hypothetical protein J3R83DRAFT_14066 [Lanmaoa asiatica]|nr:hypothetical protein J3R83DRAFT_14066 [Lanmaoa asiatica]